MVLIGLSSIAVGIGLLVGGEALLRRPLRNFQSIAGRAAPPWLASAAHWWLRIVGAAFLVAGVAHTALGK
jgi:hypothetical protein